MKIAILADPLDNQNAGIHTYTRELVRSLERFCAENEIIIIRSKKKNDFPHLKQIVVPSTKAPIGYHSIVRLFLAIPRLLRKEKVDIVFEPAHFGPFNLPKRIKRVTMIHDLTPIILSDFHRFHSQLLQKIFLKRIMRKADLILANSTNTEKDIHKVYPFTKNKTKRILLGKDDSFTANANKDILRKLNILPEQYFLFVGTIEPRKNLVVLLKAFEAFKNKTQSDYKLVITGQKGWKSDSFFKELNKHPNRKDIVLSGFVSNEELRSLYTHALAFVYPSIYEGFGLPILEAMSCGTPVIAANNSSLPEVGGDAAMYFETKDLLDLASKMELFYDNPKLKAALSLKSLAQASKFSWETYAEEFIDTLENLFEPKS
jgi:glycosyltransferase involved in cell wall biosynthesis